jgi:hypothetical protein
MNVTSLNRMLASGFEGGGFRAGRVKDFAIFNTYA